MIKKLLLILIIFFLTSIMLWGFWGWFIAKESEQQLKAFISDSFHQDELNSINAEILQYKPSFSGARITIKISSKVEFIREQIGELFLNAKLLNGPIFYDDGKLLFGKALWKISLDKSIAAEHLADTSQAKIQGLFKSKVPFLSILLGFDNSLSYQSHIRDLSSASVQIKNIVSAGKIDKNTHSNHLSVQFQGASFMTETGVISIPKLDIEINIDKQSFLSQKHLSYSTKPFFLVSGINPNDKKSFVSKGTFSHFNNKLSGIVNFNYIDNQDASLSMELHNLSVVGYQSFLQAEAQILNLQHQVQWTLEENAETPEGQDHIWQLYDQINHKRELISKIITQKVFIESDSKLKLSLVLQDEKYFLPAFLQEALQKKLTVLSDRGLINQVNNHYQIVIKSKQSDLLINGNSMAWGEFLRNIQAAGTKSNN